ncbi:hypothetical protein PIB30_013317 [Stylosanthes scabra]|uniref:Uncharacterized protein n=1 Tax=Stylosanthes scabra TaxID=79078 RepID=A0ABU6U532_9FABA|nr:hypothetical protein [Stylosanthes scabra]
MKGSSTELIQLLKYVIEGEENSNVYTGFSIVIFSLVHRWIGLKSGQHVRLIWFFILNGEDFDWSSMKEEIELEQQPLILGILHLLHSHFVTIVVCCFGW